MPGSEDFEARPEGHVKFLLAVPRESRGAHTRATPPSLTTWSLTYHWTGFLGGGCGPTSASTLLTALRTASGWSIWIKWPEFETT